MTTPVVARVAALDFGATSGRVIVGEVGADTLRMRQFARFGNVPVQAGGRLHWDVLSLWQGALDGIAAAVREVPDLMSVATDTWGVDYGLFRGGRLLGNPVHYRDGRTDAVIDRVHERMSPAEQYRRAGIQTLPINTIYQFAADAHEGVLECADTALLMPDLFTHWLSGARIAERTMASTTGLLDAVTGGWNPELVAASGVSASILPEVIAPGTRLGPLRPDVAGFIDARRPIEVIAVGSHDTASAVVAAPMPRDGAAFISCGTWGLVGLEQPRPVLTEDARTAGFTNESGVDGRYLLMRNAMGLWMLSESVRQWGAVGERIELRDLLAAASAVTRDVPIVDVDDPRFSTPGDMPARIAAWCSEHGVAAPRDRAETVRCIIESLAQAFADAALQAARVAEVTLTQINIVGGGSQNKLLCQQIADRSGLPVFAGPVEATALGSILVQARTMGRIDGTLEALRSLVERTHTPTPYIPR